MTHPLRYITSVSEGSPSMEAAMNRYMLVRVCAKGKKRKWPTPLSLVTMQDANESAWSGRP